MIVEITGPSGVGKTTLIKFLTEQLKIKGVKTGAIHSSKLNTCLLIPGRFTDVEAYNIQMDLQILPWSILGVLKNINFLYFAAIKIFTLKERKKHKIAICRSLWRKIGLHTFLSQKKFNDYLILVDEGIFHSCHNFLISSKNKCSEKDVEKFINIVPQVAGVIILNNERVNILDNLHTRGNLSPRINSSFEEERFISNSIDLYAKMSDLVLQYENVHYKKIENESTYYQCLDICILLSTNSSEKK